MAGSIGGNQPPLFWGLEAPRNYAIDERARFDEFCDSAAQDTIEYASRQNEPTEMAPVELMARYVFVPALTLDRTLRNLPGIREPDSLLFPTYYYFNLGASIFAVCQGGIPFPVSALSILLNLQRDVKADPTNTARFFNAFLSHHSPDQKPLSDSVMELLLQDQRTAERLAYQHPPRPSHGLDRNNLIETMIVEQMVILQNAMPREAIPGALLIHGRLFAEDFISAVKSKCE